MCSPAALLMCQGPEDANLAWLQGYHILALALFTPALLVDPQLLAMSMAIAAALLVLVEVVRMGNVPYAGPRIHEFMTSFIDSRDAGALLVSHFSLLAGEFLQSCPGKSQIRTSWAAPV